MTVLWYLARRRLLRRPVSTIAVVVLVAVASGGVMGLVSGARRTEAAFPRFVAATQPSADVHVLAQLDDDVPFPADDQSQLLRLLSDMPEVERAERSTHFIVRGTDATGVEQRLLATATLDGGPELPYGSPLVVEGRWPVAGDPLALAIDEELAERAGVGVGDTYRIQPYTIDQAEAAGEGADVTPAGPAADLRVAAVVRYPGDLLPADLDQRGIYVDHSDLHVGPGYWDAFGPDLARYGVGAAVELADGVSVDDLGAALQAEVPDRWMFEFAEVGGDLDGMERAISLQARTMLGVALVTAVTGVALTWLVLGRRAAADTRQQEVLEGLGLGNRSWTVLAAVEGAVLGSAAAVVALVAAWVSSAWTPFGLARRAELDPGMRLDVVVSIVGGVATIGVVALVSAAAGRRRRAAVRDRVKSARSVGLRAPGPVAACGLAFALQSERGGRGAPVRTALVGVAAAAAVVVGVAVLAASFGVVRDDPTRRGAYWDVAVGNFSNPAASDDAMRWLDAEEVVAGYAGETSNQMEIEGELTSVVAFFAGSGGMRPLVAAGRPPEADDEIALGGRLLERFDVGIGDTVQVAYTGDEPLVMTVVGQALVDDVEASIGGPGKAAVVTEPGLRALDPLGAETEGPTWLTVRLRDDVDEAAALERLEQRFPMTVTTPRMPSDLENLERLDGSVLLLAALVGVLGTGAALIAMVGAVARRRRELAVLRSLGLSRSQSAGIIAWQATVFAVLGLGLGVPAGVIAGRWTWRLLADDVGLVPAPVVPLGVVAAIVFGTIVVLNGVAAVPRRSVTRLEPASALRSE